MTIPDAVISLLTAFGAAEISYVESVILSGAAAERPARESPLKKYWLGLSLKHRYLFWSGFFFMLSPFAVPLFGLSVH